METRSSYHHQSTLKSLNNWIHNRGQVEPRFLLSHVMGPGNWFEILFTERWVEPEQQESRAPGAKDPRVEEERR